jgi:hypothetical protein
MGEIISVPRTAQKTVHECTFLCDLMCPTPADLPGHTFYCLE